ncbi:MAG: D-alanyl-D-alanine carboxypeptidase [Coriobacteriia bacterium]|nr:D-alanyl-D-alanine carboxypeptidase [Coriobacteriia bacterium]MBS5477960.1 D-alanyl-D-alanine carboxypeptidase [Coriobacteriia bacterium]
MSLLSRRMRVTPASAPAFPSPCTMGRQGVSTFAHAARTALIALACTLAVLIGTLLQPTPAFAADWSAYGEADAPALNATEAIVEDGDGTVLFTRDASTSMPMASTTKVMTAVVALESGVSLDTTFPISEYAVSNQGTVAGFVAGEQHTLYDLLRVLLVHSAGDAAVAIAEGVAGSEAAFVDMMNAKAAELGLTGTHYTSPDGLSDTDHYSTPSDLVTLARHAMGIDQFRSIVGTKSITISVNGVPTTFTNTSPILNAYPGAQGIKTGFTYGAGRAFVGVVSRGDVEIWFSILGCESEEARRADLWSLLDWAYGKYPATTLVTASTPVLGYVNCGYRFGRMLGSTTSVDASLRSSASTGMTTTLIANDGVAFAMPGERLGSLTWVRAGLAVQNRVVTADWYSCPVHTYGPFVSQLFYELDLAVRRAQLNMPDAPVLP